MSTRAATGLSPAASAAKARVIRLEESALTRPGPRVFDALERLADALHPRAGKPGP